MTDPAWLSVPVLGGLAAVLASFWAWHVRPRDAAAQAQLGAFLPVAAALLTTGGAGSPAWLAVLNGLAISLIPAGLLHLALTFPVDRLRDRRSAALALLYVPALALALVTQVVGIDPAAVDALTRVTITLVGCAAIALGGALLLGALRGSTVMTRRRATLALLGALPAGAVLLLSPSSTAAGVAVEFAAPTAFLFPLAVGAALRPHGLPEIDEVLRRTLTGALLAVTLVATYVVTFLAVHALDPSGTLLGVSPEGVALLNLGIVFVVAALRDAVRSLIDRFLAPAVYDSEACLVGLSRGLASARTVPTVVTHARDVITAALQPCFTSLYLPHGASQYRPATGSGRPVIVPPGLAVALERGEIVAIDDVTDARDALPAPWNAVDTAVLVPLRANRTVVGLLVLGRRPGRSYTAQDITFLRSAAYQVALALLGSAAFDQIDTANQRLNELNNDLERQVSERTADLQSKNQELNDSLADLQQAYRRLEEHSAALLRAERLAALGRLTAGLAHEINTPLSAVMNALKILDDLAREYQAGIDDPEVLPADHREIAREMQTNTRSASEWAQKAAGYIRNFKAHTREAGNQAARPFALRQVVDDARALVAHRARAAGCRIDFSEEPDGLMLVGDPAQLGQVLVNLITNAADAYEEAGMSNGRIAVHAVHNTNGGVRLRVTDWAGGIPTAILPRIFEELYTTKPPGRGTGLGLWIARSLIERGFGGTLDVLTSRGSSCFVADLPADAVLVPCAPQAMPEAYGLDAAVA